MARFDLTDFEWSMIQPLLPNKPRGVPRVDDWRVLNGIFWRLRTGAPWKDIPERYGPHTTCVNRQRPADRLKLTEGQAHDGRSAADMLLTLAVGDILLGDRAYDSDGLRPAVAERGTWANVKPMPNRKNVPAFSAFLYRYRNAVERFLNKLKHFRGVATRYYKRAYNYLAGVKLALASI